MILLRGWIIKRRIGNQKFANMLHKGLSPHTSKLFQELFQEEWYLKRYPDVLQAKECGLRNSGWSHFSTHGFSEGRLPFPFDDTWYLTAYAASALEIRAGFARNALEHFVLFGAARGYLPERRAVRPNNARLQNPFGGLWIDSPNANDLLQGRLETGMISENEVVLLNQFREQGFVVLKAALPLELLTAARSALDQAYQGRYRELKFECHSVSRDQISWRPEINGHAAKAIDIHMFSPELRNAMFTEDVKRFLNIIFECQPLASQTLGFLRGSAQEAHQDSAYVAYTMPRQFAASWIALEDVRENAGELFYYPGSHFFDDFTYGTRFKSVSEAKRSGVDPKVIAREVTEHVNSLPKQAEKRGIAKQTFLAKAGDVLIWHSDLAHGGLSVSKENTRKSLVTHYCPRFVAPLFTESGAIKYFKHETGCYFVSGAYPSMSPLG